MQSGAFSVKVFLAIPVVLLALGGCINPEQSFNDFGNRYDKINGSTGGSGGTGGTGGVDGGCVPPGPGDLSGHYLFTLSAKLSPTTPILFDATVSSVAASGGSGSALKLNLQALSAKDRKTPVGTPLDVPPITIDQNGQLDDTHPLPSLTVAAEANAITGSQITATATLHGEVCGVKDFYCGTVTGNVTNPVTLSLDGSTYTLDKNSSEPPLINCAKDPAKPLP